MEIVGCRENVTNMTEEVLEVLCVAIEYYCSVLCAQSEGPTERKCGIRQTYKLFSTLIDRLIIKATCSGGKSAS